MPTPKSQPIAAGARVLVRDEEWIVQSWKAEASGGRAVTVEGVSELVRGKRAIFLDKLDEVKVLVPEETELVPDTSSGYLNSRLFLESLARRSPATDTKIHLGHKAAIDPVDYQLRPTARALKLLRPRFLMADGVGLGKTIEVGVLLSELMRRGRARRILVVAMKSILAQFQEELWGRFTIPLVRLDSVGIQRVQTQIPSTMNPFHFFDRVIVSVDTLKNDVKYRQYLEDCRWDVVVIDECQNVALRTKQGNRGSQRAQLAQLLARRTDSLILTSATPHDGSAESFASLIHLLEPTAIADENDFTKDEVAPYFQRYFKKDIAHELEQVFPERLMKTHSVATNAQEDAVLERLQEVSFKAIGKRRSGGMLFRTTLLKEFLSSPAACISVINNRLKHKDMRIDELEGDARINAEHDQEVLYELRHLAELAGQAGVTKYAKLLRRVRAILNGESEHERVVVFSERIATLDFLAQSLSRDLGLDYNDSGKPNQIEIFSGSLNDQGQMGLVKSFGSKQGPIKILLASDAAAEGINLHYYCHHLIHFDLPWSLITLVQRNGRIDRFGQKHEPVIEYLMMQSSIEGVRADLRVLDRLTEKEEQVQKNLGDAAWLMGLFDEEKEEERIAQAVEGDVSPEEALPDDPVEDEDHDWFSELFEENEDEAIERGGDSGSRLFSSDLEFAHAALTSVLGVDEKVVQERAHGLELRPPKDLEQRYQYLPPELTRGRKTIRLTDDREEVKKAIEVARQQEGEWPEWELFWPLHPVCEWLDGRVLSHLGRHAAWTIQSSLIEGADALFFFQGVLSSKAGQSVCVDWFSIPFRDGQSGEPIDRDETLRQSGLTEGAGNPGEFEIPSALKNLLPKAVEVARDHMGIIRSNRAQELSVPLRKGVRELQQWKKKREKLVQQELVEGLSSKGTVDARKRTQAERMNQEASRIFKERMNWIERLQTGDEPYLRLAAVFFHPSLMSNS
jgi:superfamily II DNA or RNA helicase